MTLFASVNSPDFIEFVEKGVAIEELEKRLRPAKYDNKQHEKDVREHAGYANFSREGFIGNDEKLLDTIYKDCKTLESYGVKHHEIAAALNRLISINSEEVKKIFESLNSLSYKLLPKFVRKRLGMRDEIGDSHSCESILNDGYNYKLSSLFTFGEQNCPWGCNSYGQNAGVIYHGPLTKDQKTEIMFAQMGGIDAHEDSINEAFAGVDDDFVLSVKRIKKARNARQEPYYAPITHLLPHLIEVHYFFEGTGSPYRADPTFLIKSLKLR